MNRLAPLFALLLVGLSAFFAGCSTKTNRDSSIPWSRPANWEGGIPGMGSPDQDQRR